MKITRLSVLAAVGLGILALAGCVTTTNDSVMKTDPNKARVDAEFTLRSAADDRDPVTRMNAMEALSQVGGEKAYRIYRQGLEDPADGVRFASAIAIGDTITSRNAKQYADAKAKLTKMASEDPAVGEPEKRVYAAVLYALYKLDEKTYARGMARLLRDEQWKVRDSAALLLGKMGNPVSINLLKLQLGSELNNLVKVRIVESLAMLGDARSMIVLASYTQENSLDETLIAIDAMTSINAKGFAKQLGYLTQASHPTRIRVRAVGALAQLGYFDQGGYDFVILTLTDPERVLQDSFKGQMAITPLEVNLTQELAAKSLGQMGQVSAVDALSPLLKSSFGPLRVSAARSILQLLPPQAELLPVSAVATTAPATAPAGGTTTRPQSAKPAPTTTSAPTTRPRPKLGTAGAKD